jgi:hypothetical protein
MNDDLWELYTFFRNEFNVLEIPEDTDLEQEPQIDLGDTFMGDENHNLNGDHVNSKATGECENKPPHHHVDTDDSKSNTDLRPIKAECCVLKISDSSVHWDPYFKVKIMQTVMECMNHRDIHRYYLLQHIKFLLNFLPSFSESVYAHS